MSFASTQEYYDEEKYEALLQQLFRDMRASYLEAGSSNTTFEQFNNNLIDLCTEACVCPTVNQLAGLWSKPLFHLTDEEMWFEAGEVLAVIHTRSRKLRHIHLKDRWDEFQQMDDISRTTIDFSYL